MSGQWRQANLTANTDSLRLCSSRLLSCVLAEIISKSSEEQKVLPAHLLLRGSFVKI